jgi:two-component system chemotaxis response regulator CheB
MAPIRILIVDDSVVIRRLLSDTLSGDPALEVVATASDGRIALAKISLLKPDLITLDVEMPVMDGLETLAALRKLYPKLPVIMFSTLTERGAAATLDALSLGASDYATKPSHTGSPAVAIERIRAELIPKIKALCGGKVPLKFPPLSGFRPAVKVRPRSSPRIEIVAIGSSTGGPNALTALIPQFPADFPVPIVIVQHMPPLFTRLLADRLNTLARLEVQEGKEGQRVQRGQVWIAPGDYHMTVVHKGSEFVLATNRDPHGGGRHSRVGRYTGRGRGGYRSGRSVFGGLGHARKCGGLQPGRSHLSSGRYRAGSCSQGVDAEGSCQRCPPMKSLRIYLAMPGS